MGKITEVVQADTTDEEGSLEALGVRNFDES